MPLPDPHRGAALAAFSSLREEGVPVADIAYDSALAGDAPAGAQSPPRRHLRFRLGARGVDLWVDDRAHPVQVEVRLVPPGPGHVEMRVGGSRLPAVRVPTDERGRASLALASQLVSFLATPDAATPGPDGAGGPLRTAWLRL